MKKSAAPRDLFSTIRSQRAAYFPLHLPISCAALGGAASDDRRQSIRIITNSKSCILEHHPCRTTLVCSKASSQSSLRPTAEVVAWSVVFSPWS